MKIDDLLAINGEARRVAIEECIDICESFSGWRDVEKRYPDADVSYTDAAWMAGILADHLRDLL